MIDELVTEYINNNNSTNIEAYKAGFTKCVDIIEQTFKNKQQIMLSLRAIIQNNKLVVVARPRNTNAPDMVMEVKEGGKTLITLSQTFFDKAKLQENKLMCVFEPGDHKVYFIVHNDESLYADFMNGKRLALKDEEGKDVVDAGGKKVYADKIGIKSRTFQDKKTSQDLTLVELLEKVTILDNKTEFNLIEKPINSLFTDASEFNVTSIWQLQNKKDIIVEELESFEQEESKDEELNMISVSDEESNQKDQTEELQMLLDNNQQMFNNVN